MPVVRRCPRSEGHVTTAGWETWWSKVPARPGAEWCSGWADNLHGIVWTELRVPAPIAVRFALEAP